MSKVVANLDAAIEAYQVQQGEVDRILRLFGRDWTLLSDISTAALNPILQVQAMAEEAKTEDQINAVGVRALSALQETIVGSVIESEREDLKRSLTSIGFPMGALEIVMEHIMGAFTAAPLPTQDQETAQTQIQEQPVALTSDSGKSSTQNGQISNPVSTPQPPMPQTAIPGLVPREPTPELQETDSERWMGAEEVVYQ